MESVIENQKIYVVGHKNPDTDSVCSAIAYAELKGILTGNAYVARRAGQLNEETHFVLNKFGVKIPLLLSDLRVQVKDVELRKVEGIDGSVSIKTAWRKMRDLNTKTLPVIRDCKLEGLITVGDIANSYMDVYDNEVLSTARTQYRNIVAVVDGVLLTGNEYSYILQGKVLVLAGSYDLNSQVIAPNDLVILSDQPKEMQLAIDSHVSCMVVCQAAEISADIIQQAEEKEIVLISSSFDPYTVARLMNQSIPIKYFMTKEGIMSFQLRDYLDDIKPLMVQKKYRDFPVSDSEGRFLGFLSRRCLIKSSKKQVILVDHNEKSQAVDGIEQAEVLEIIDHHRIGNLETMGPVFFRNQPVGCTATIIYQMYEETLTKLSKETAGLLCSAIISDTLMFRSPTCTTLDEYAARQLSHIAQVDIKDLAEEMFNAGSNIKSKSTEDIILTDFKQFTVGDSKFGVGQLNSMNEEEIKTLSEIIPQALDQVRIKQNLEYLYFMITNILDESTQLYCSGTGAKGIVRNAFDLTDDLLEEVYLKGVVSRKKQLVPTLVAALQQ
ncbi:MAG: putative manganese-dependent inorganic diphosphatase [Lachnospiraceae bacterium]|nr:putative manganese-dependent inorganic diphosphatase [Lachnospiraceae bacterium]